jgi:class 3 adenylate cyclase/tetratricopeptide (TPR) repeat protein
MSAVLKTLLISDLVNSTKHIEEMGDEKAFHLFSAHDRMARDLLSPNNGLEIDKTDGFLLLFERPIDAIVYALGYHRGLARLSTVYGRSIKARVGIHFGEVFLRENPAADVEKGAKPLEVEGIAKPAAARLMSAALPGQILLTRAAFDLARRGAVGREELENNLVWLAHGAFLFKGIQEPVDVFEVGVPDDLPDGSPASPLRVPEDSEKVKKILSRDTLEGWRPGQSQSIPHRNNWVLVEKLGEGGFGEVWLAENRKTGDPRVYKFCFERDRIKGLQREVTLFRLLKTTLGNRKDIARILDWNFEEAPFFIELEYSRGGSLLDWADKQGGIDKVPLSVRLNIFVQITQALGAAHSVGILHKDLKPANILIVNDGSEGDIQAKLTDFGIGLVTDSKRLEDAGITVLGFTENQISTQTSGGGTLQFMAPELLTGSPATVQADIYALGVFLLQMVVGDFSASLAPGWRRKVVDPLLIEDISLATDGSLDLRLRDAGELARRILHLEKRREIRANKAREKEEAEAARVSLVKAQKRKKLFLAIALLSVLFSGVTLFQARRITLEMKKAELESRTANQVTEFMTSLFKLQEGEDGLTVTGRELLDRGSTEIAVKLKNQPALQVRLLEGMGYAYINLGLLSEAENLFEKGRSFAEMYPEEDILHLLNCRAALAYLRGLKGNYADAVKELGGICDQLINMGDAAEESYFRGMNWQVELLRLSGDYSKAVDLVGRIEKEQKKNQTGGHNRIVKSTASVRLMDLQKKIHLPAQVTWVIPPCLPRDMTIATAVTGVYQIDLNSKRSPDFIPFASGESAVCSLRDGRVGIQKGNTFFLRNYKSPEKHMDDVVFKRMPAGTLVFSNVPGDTYCQYSRNQLVVYSYSQGVVKKNVAIKADLPKPDAFTMTRNFASWYSNKKLFIADFNAGIIKIVPFKDDGRIEALAINEAFGMLAVGGWFDDVILFDLKTSAETFRFSLKGRTYSLKFLNDYPSLFIGKLGRLALWRPDQGVLWQHAQSNAKFKVMGLGHGGLFAYDFANQELSVFSYQNFNMKKKIKVSSRPLWAWTSLGDGKTFFCGGADGVLHQISIPEGTVKSIQHHTQGITNMIVVDAYLVTGSDDKTIVVWETNPLRVKKQIKAHEFLVNYLFFDNETQKLWSSSSDSTLKCWSWPDLNLETTLRVPDLAVPFAGFWLSDTEGYGFAGQWGSEFFPFIKENQQWVFQQPVPISGSCLYATLAMPELHGVFALILNPAGLLYYHIPSHQFFSIPIENFNYSGLIQYDAQTIYLLGSGACLSVSLKYQDDYLSYTVKQGLNTSMGNLINGACFNRGRMFAACTESGEVCIFNHSDFKDIPGFQGRISIVQNRANNTKP